MRDITLLGKCKIEVTIFLQENKESTHAFFSCPTKKKEVSTHE